jgi:type I restriction enzyme S subunit
MPNRWTDVKLAEVCSSIDYGHTAAAGTVPVGPKFLRITDIVSGGIDWSAVPHCDVDADTHEKCRLHAGDVVIARTGATTGYSTYIAEPPDAIFASYLVRLKVQGGVESRFIAYYLKGQQFWNYMRGVLGDKSAQPNAGLGDLSKFPPKLPSLASPVGRQRRLFPLIGFSDFRQHERGVTLP